MSFDRRIDKVCSHYVLEEPLYVSDDQVTVRPLRPIASASSVSVQINGVTDVPSYGVHVPALATGSKIGPFSITSSNNQLVLEVDGGSAQTLTVPTGTRVTARQLVASLNAAAQGVYFSATSSNRVQIETKSSGLGAILSLHSGSTLAATLGLSTSRVWRGKTPYPGWSLIQDPNTLSDRPTKLLVFDSPVKGFRTFVELDYATIREECRRCGGLGVENDWTYTVEGEVAEVRDYNLLLQEVQKICFTVRGSNVFHTWYGTNVIETIGKKLTASGIVQNFIVSDLYEAFRRWQDIKRQQEETVGQTVSDGEYPFKLIGVNLEPSDQDPTIVFVTVNMQSRASNKIIPVTRSLKLPEPLDILGSSTQQSIFEQTLSGYTLTG